MLCVTAKIDCQCRRWVNCGGSGRVRRPSGLPSIADIPLHCREPPVGANARNRFAIARFAGWRRRECGDRGRELQ